LEFYKHLVEFTVFLSDNGVEIEAEDGYSATAFGQCFLWFQLYTDNVLAKNGGEQLFGDFNIFEQVLEDDIVEGVGNNHVGFFDFDANDASVLK